MHVLVVDADFPSLKLVEFLLHPFQATITQAQSGSEALSLARRQAYDLIILDVDLPGPGGLDIIRKMHADPAFQTVPIVATAFADEGRGAEILRAGCRAWVRKPLDTREFPKIIRSIIAG